MKSVHLQNLLSPITFSPWFLSKKIMTNSPKDAQEHHHRRVPDTAAQQIRANLAICFDTEQLIRDLDCIDPDNATVNQKKE